MNFQAEEWDRGNDLIISAMTIGNFEPNKPLIALAKDSVIHILEEIK